MLCGKPNIRTPILTIQIMANQTPVLSKSRVASPLAAITLFLCSLFLHRVFDWLPDLLEPTGGEFKLWGIGTLVVAILLPLFIAIRLLKLHAAQALNLVQPK